jgi:general L-amino acid transport system substrate-binding protein
VRSTSSPRKNSTAGSICIQGGTTSELNIADFFPHQQHQVRGRELRLGDEALAAFGAGRCDGFTTDASALFGYRLKAADPKQFVVLPEMISKEPLGPVVRRGDEAWANIVRWTHFAMVNAEELGVSKDNVDEQMKSANPEIKRLLGTEGKLGETLGLSTDWAYRIVKHVGNYGEVFDRNVGPNSRLAIPRGLNNLWSKGGLQYAPPIR